MEEIINPVRKSKFQILQQFYPPQDILVFDIETTGFAAEKTTLYLIGCACMEDGVWKVRQWFNEDGASEQQLLERFFSFTEGFQYVLTYNGDGFDIPYLQKKAAAYGMETPFAKLKSIDLYKQIRPLKQALHMDNLKQKSAERFLGIHRLDKYSGGDLIRVYREYLKLPVKTNKQLLLQHNYEDLEGLLDCTCLLSYCRFAAGDITVCRTSLSGSRLLFSLKLTHPLPRRITLGLNDILITGIGSEATVSVPILSDEMKFFFENYREYYYLPAEDYAVHKSVAGFVDKNYRKPATKETCYVRKTGYFITQLDKGILTGFRKNYADKETFIDLSDSFLQNPELLRTYIRYVLRHAFS